MGTVTCAMVIRTSPHDVWNVLREFHDVRWFPGSRIVCSRGATRVLDAAGRQFEETALVIDDRERRLEYRTAPIDVWTRIEVGRTHDGYAMAMWTSTVDDERLERRYYERVPIVLAHLKRHCETALQHADQPARTS